MRTISKASKPFRVGRTNEDEPCEQFRIYRRIDGAVEVYAYADTRQDADSLCRVANSNGAL